MICTLISGPAFILFHTGSPGRLFLREIIALSLVSCVYFRDRLTFPGLSFLSVRHSAAVHGDA